MSIEQILAEQCKNWTIPIEQKVNWPKVILTISQIPQKSFEQLVTSTNKFYLTNGQLNKSQLNNFLLEQNPIWTILNSSNS